MATKQGETIRARLQAGAGIVLSIVILAAVIVLTTEFGLGVRTTYGTGIGPALGDQVVHDFLLDQQAEASALSSSDSTQLTGHVSDAALSDVLGQMAEAGSGTGQTVSFQPASLTVLRSQDPSDPTLVLEVQEDGVRNVTISGGPNSAPTQDQVSFQGDFWLRLGSDRRYTIADQEIRNLPTSYLPQIALVAAGFLWVALAYALMRRISPGPGRLTETAPRLLPQFQPAAGGDHEGEPPAPKVAIRTFGGLRVMQDGQDWAPSLNSRPVMSYIWHRVLIAGVQDRAVPRDELSRQTNPKLDREVQLERLRKLLNKSLPAMPEALRSRITVEPQLLKFNRDDCSVDAIELVRLSDELPGRGVLSSGQAARVRRVLGESAGTFLAEFESVEDIATDHHPSSNELITSLRKELARRRETLILRLAATYMANRRPDQAIALLEPARRDSAGTEVRENLAAAYRAAGREADARGLAGLNA